jgi:hypothetical protein
MVGEDVSKRERSDLFVKRVLTRNERLRNAGNSRGAFPDLAVASALRLKDLVHLEVQGGGRELGQQRTGDEHGNELFVSRGEFQSPTVEGTQKAESARRRSMRTFSESD